MNRITQYYVPDPEHGCERELLPSEVEALHENHRLHAELAAARWQRNWLLLGCAVLVFCLWR